MKKFLLVILIILVVFSAAYAQNAGETSAGARAGMLFGFHSFSDEFRRLFDAASELPINISDRALNNFNLAIFGSYAFTNNFSVQAELIYMINQGMEISARLLGFGSTVRGTYSSLDIPILLKYSFINAPAKLGVLGGPHVSLPLGYFELKETGIGFGPLVGEYGVGFPTFGITVGLFGGFPVGPGRITGDLRYLMDFTYLKIRPFGEDIDVAARRGISAGIGYEFIFRR